MVVNIEKILAPLYRRMRMLAGRAVIRLVNDSFKEQSVQVDILSGETRQAERYQHFGFTSHPIPGAEAIVLTINGSRDHLVAVADGDRRYRPKDLAPGESAVYNSHGITIKLKQNKVEITSPLVELNGNLTVGDAITAQGTISSATSVSDPVGTMQGMRDTYNSHTHPENGSTTSEPNEGMS